MAPFILTGRILFLTVEPALVGAQLAGRDLEFDDVGELRDDVSTDEITPIPVLTLFDERLGDFPYVGYETRGQRPVPQGAVKQGGFQVTVAGHRYGKGSSREHSPLAERSAGIRLVIAKSFERIYRQNADNLGLITSTDFGLVERLCRREAITWDEIIGSRDSLSAEILSAGGLLRYGQRRSWDFSRFSGKQERDARPKTLAHKILERNLLTTPGCRDAPATGQGCFVRTDWRFIHEYYTGMASHLLRSAFRNDLEVVDAPSLLTFEDHLSYAHLSAAHRSPEAMLGISTLCKAHRDFARAHGLREHGRQTGGVGSEGISHPLMTERYALPGQLVVGTDSHTPHSGALGCLAFGVGTTDMANAMVTGAVRMIVPDVLRVEIDGQLAEGVTAKDIALRLLADPRIRDGAGVGKVFEFAGSVVRALDVDERATLTNMTAELGGFAGIVEPDEQTCRFLRERRDIEFTVEPWMRSDALAHYADILRFDCSDLSPMVALPGDPGNGIPLNDLIERPSVDIAYGGSCTAGKRSDFDQYHNVLSWAVTQGLRVARNVKLYLQFGTEDVARYCERMGYLSAFERVGAELLQPSCGACANCGPGASESANDVTVSAINRNFPGRSGPGKVWLANPYTVAASAIAGRLVSFDELRRLGGEENAAKADWRFRNHQSLRLFVR